MRKDILIIVNSENNKVKVDNKTLGITSENLQGKIIFKPEPFVDGVCRLYVDGKGSILMDKQEDCYTVNILSSLLTEDSLDVCFKITEPETEDGIPIFCSKIMHFRVLETIDSSSTIPEDYPSWEQVLDSMMAKVEQMESDAEDRLDEVVGQIQDLTSEYNTNATNKTNSFNNNYTTKLNSFNSHVNDIIDAFDDAMDEAEQELDDYAADKVQEVEAGKDALIQELTEHEEAKEVELDTYTNAKKTELNTYTNTKKGELDAYEEDKEDELSSFASNKTSDFNSNASAKTTAFNENASDKTDDFDDNATSKTSAFNDNASSKTSDFNTNATNKTNAYNTNHTEKMTEYNNNATSKVSDYNTNATNKTSEFNQNATNKTNDFNDNATAKIAEYDEHVAELQGEIDDLNTLVDTEFDTNVVEETTLDVSDSAEYRGRIEVKGNTEQEQLSGKNLLNFSNWTSKEVNGVRWTNNGDGTVTANGTATDNSDFYVIKDYSTKYTGDYTISGCPSGGSATTYYVLQDIGNKSDFGNGVTKSFNNESFAVRLRIMKGYTANGILFRPMIELGITKTDFEPYCGGQAAPNSSYEIPIKVVTGDNVVKHVGKNLFDSSFNMITPYGVTVTYEDGIITINGTLNNQGFVTIRNDLLNMIGIGNHTLIFQYLSGTQDGGSIRFSFGNSNMSALADNDDRCFSIVSTNNNNSNIVQVKDFDNVKKIMRWGVWINNNITFNNYKFRLYVVKGAYTANTIPVYEPYKEEEYNLNLGNIELCKIVDYSDILFKNSVGDENYNAELESGAWYKRNEVGKKVFDGTENISNSGVNTNNYYYMMKTVIGNAKSARNDNEIVPIFSNFFKSGFSYSSLGNAKAGTDGICIAQNHTITFCNHNYDKTKTSDFKVWLGENRPCVYYPLETPTYEKITNPTLISQLEALRKAKWFKGVNHWWTETNNLEPNLKGTYKQSNNLRIKEQDERLDNLESRLALLE